MYVTAYWNVLTIKCCQRDCGFPEYVSCLRPLQVLPVFALEAGQSSFVSIDLPELLGVRILHLRHDVHSNLIQAMFCVIVFTNSDFALPAAEFCEVAKLFTPLAVYGVCLFLFSSIDNFLSQRLNLLSLFIDHLLSATEIKLSLISSIKNPDWFARCVHTTCAGKVLFPEQWRRSRRGKRSAFS